MTERLSPPNEPGGVPRPGVSSILNLEEVTKSFNSVTVLTGVNLTLSRGELVGVVGPNGCGKSTLFGLIAGHLSCDSGRVSFIQQDVTKTSPAARAQAGIGRTFQVPRAFSSMSVFENLMVAATFAGKMRGSEAEDYVLEVSARTGFAGRERVLSRDLPLLDRKRLELARSMAAKPKLLLLDEIAGGLTDGEALSLADLIKSLLAEGMTIIWVEHLMHVLIKSVSRMIVLGGGKIIADGAPRETMDNEVVRALYFGPTGS